MFNGVYVYSLNIIARDNSESRDDTCHNSNSNLSSFAFLRSIHSKEMSASCDAIRKKINMFLATKEMTQTEFLRQIGGVNSNSFQRFMKLKGAYSGSDNGTYRGAVELSSLIREMLPRRLKRLQRRREVKSAAEMTMTRKLVVKEENPPRKLQ